MTVFDNPYIKQLGLLPFREQPQPSPLEGLLSPRGLTAFGANMLANPSGNFFEQLGQGIGGAVSAVDAYNERLNKNALEAAKYNLDVGELAASYDVGMAQAAAAASKQQQADMMQNLLLAKFGITPPAPVAPVTAGDMGANTDGSSPLPLASLDTVQMPSPRNGEVIGVEPPINAGGILPQIDANEITPTVPAQAPTGLLQQPATPKFAEKIQEGQEMTKIGGLLGQAPLVSAGKEITDVGIAERDKYDGKVKTDQVLGDLVSTFQTMRDKGALRVAGGNELENIAKGVANSPVGQYVNTLRGTEEQDLRDLVNSKKPLIKIALIQAAGGAKAFDSNNEGKSLFEALGSENKSFEANMKILEGLSKSYGLGSIKAAELIGAKPQVGGQKSTVKPVLTPAQAKAELERRKRGR